MRAQTVFCRVLGCALMVLMCLLTYKAMNHRKVSSTAASNEEGAELATVTSEPAEASKELVIKDKGATFVVSSSSKNSLAPVAPENPHLNK